MSDTSVHSDTQTGAESTPLDLSEFDDNYRGAVPLANSEVPDGKYEVRMVNVSLGRSQKGDAMLTFDMVVLSGPHANRHIFKNSVITQASLPVVKSELERLGLEMQRFSELPSRLGELVDVKLSVAKRTKGEYANVYFNKRTMPF